MLRGQVVRLLGRDGDPAQFRPFQFPLGCWLEVSSVIAGRVVSVHVAAPPAPQPPCAERERLRRGVSAAYIRALGGPESEPERATEEEEKAAGLCTWLEAVESCTHASALTLAWTGAVRIEARPTFTISVYRTRAPPSSGPITVVEVASEGIPAITTTVPSASKRGAPTVRSVVDAFRNTGLADVTKYEFNPDWDQQLAPCLGGHGGLFLLSVDERSTNQVTVTPRRLCVLCNTYTLRPDYISVYPTVSKQYLDAMTMCTECATSFGEEQRVVRLWGAEFTLSVDGQHAPVFFTVEFSAFVKVVHTDGGLGELSIEQYHAQCRAGAVEGAAMSIWQHMAHLAMCHAEDLLLRIAGLRSPKLKSPLLGLLSAATIRKILAHLAAAVLPPSRAHIERGPMA